MQMVEDPTLSAGPCAHYICKKNSSLTLCGAVFILQAQVHYQMPGSLGVLQSIFAVPRTALFSTKSVAVVPGIC